MKKYEKPAIEELNLGSTVSFMVSESGVVSVQSRKDKGDVEEDDLNEGW